MLRKMPASGLTLLALEEARSDVVLLQHLDERYPRDALASVRQRQCPLQRRELAIDRCVSSAFSFVVSLDSRRSTPSASLYFSQRIGDSLSEPSAARYFGR